jgi:hypothetical protein
VINDVQSHVHGGIVNIINNETANYNFEDIKLINADVFKVALECFLMLGGYLVGRA